MLDKEMIHDLVLESREHLQSIEPDLLTMEQSESAVSDELINRVFRAIHSIKGGFGFFGITEVTNLAHAMENVLSRIRDHAIVVDPQLTDALLKGIDKLRILMDDVAHTEDIPIDQELQMLQPFRSDIDKIDILKSELDITSSELSKLHPGIDFNKIHNCLKEGKFIYRFKLTITADDKLKIEDYIKSWDEIGTVIDFVTEGNSTGNKSIYYILLATVLEQELVGTVCGIDNKVVQKVDIQGTEFKKTTTEPTIHKQIKKDPLPVIESKPAEDTLRVRVALLNNLMNLAGELVLSRNQLLLQFNHKLSEMLKSEQTFTDLQKVIATARTTLEEHAQRDKSGLVKTCFSELNQIQTKLNDCMSILIKDLPGVNTTLQSIDSVTSQLQENIMQTRLQPISVVFNKFPRVVRDLAHKLGKEIRLEMNGQDVELDKSIVELLSDPLNHLVRNSTDHGLELPEVRKSMGKPVTGTILLHAYQEGGKVLVEISDDGRGIDVERIKEVAIERGLITEKTASEMSTHELQLLIMQPGFSTAKQVSDISGRGVGMDVVKSNIERLGGTVSIESQKGSGTKITLTLPLTLAIIPTLIVAVEGRTFAIPQVGVEELVRIRSFELTQKIERVQGAEVTRLRGKLLPLVRLAEVLNIQPTFIHPVTGERLPDRRVRWSDRRGKPSEQAEMKEKDERRTGSSDRRNSVANAVKIVVLKTGQHLYGLVVDSVYESEEIVVKPLPDYLKSTQCYAGATIMGDGKVALILDPSGIAQKSGLRFVDIDKKSHSETNGETQKVQSNTRDVLLFNNGTAEKFGLDLSSVARIEQAHESELEMIGTREFLNRNGSTLPLIRLHEYLPVNAPDKKPVEFFVIIPRSTEHNMGIIASQVQDTATLTGKIDLKQIRGTGILGSVILENHMTIMLDVPSLLQTAEKHFEDIV